MGRPRYRHPGTGQYNPGPYTQQSSRPRERAPRDLANELFADNGDYLIQETAGIARAEEEPYLDLVSSQGWNDAMKYIVIPILGKIKRELLKDLRLSEGTRIGDIRTIALFGAIIEAVYKRSGQEMPGWIRSEIT